MNSEHPEEQSPRGNKARGVDTRGVAGEVEAEVARTELLREVERDRFALVELRLAVDLQRWELPEQDRCMHTRCKLHVNCCM